jgi:hypothetical protein
MASWYRDVVRRSSLGLDARSAAERSAAVEALRSFADLDFRSTGAPQSDPDVEAVVAEVSKASQPISIVDLAKALGWDPDKLSTALARGGSLGRLAFSKAGARTFVALPAAAAT